MRLMSVCATPINAAKTAVMAPTQVTTSRAVETGSINGYTRATKNTPAATIVAACMSALTGVGPSMASGNQTCSGTCPDFPIAPQNISSEMAVETPRPTPVDCATSRVNADCSRQPFPLS